MNTSISISRLSIIFFISSLLVSLASTILFTPNSLKNLHASIFNVDACVDKCTSRLVVVSALSIIPGSDTIIASTPTLSRFFKYSSSSGISLL